MKQYATSRLAFALLAIGLSIPLDSASAHDAAGHPTQKELSRNAAGVPGDPARVDRTVPIEMTNAMRFDPSSIVVAKHETIRFTIHNAGAMTHEFVLGMRSDLARHAEMMKKMPGMEHRASNMATLFPGEKADVVWRFTRPGRVDFACLQPGHYEAGMRGQVRVGADPGAHEGH